jgi:hypothetical protein
MAAPKGHTYTQYRRHFHAAILEELGYERPYNAKPVTAETREIARVLINQAKGGDIVAIKEVIDRVDGKALQSVALDGDGEGGPIKVTDVTVRLVDAAIG